MSADKVIPGVGLVVTLYDLLEVGSGNIPPSDGAVHFRSKFRLVVFCPFEGEVLLGKLLKSTECVPRKCKREPVSIYGAETAPLK